MLVEELFTVVALVVLVVFCVVFYEMTVEFEVLEELSTVVVVVLLL